jgi:hypothetical protein
MRLTHILRFITNFRNLWLTREAREYYDADWIIIKPLSEMTERQLAMRMTGSNGSMLLKNFQDLVNAVLLVVINHHPNA